MADLSVVVVHSFGLTTFPTASATEFSFDSPAHAALDGYWFRFNDGDGDVVDNSDYFAIGSVSYAAGTVTMDETDLDITGLTPSSTYNVEVRTQQTVDSIVIYGPWSDTGHDYTA